MIYLVYALQTIVIQISEQKLQLKKKKKIKKETNTGTNITLKAATKGENVDAYSYSTGNS